DQAAPGRTLRRVRAVPAQGGPPYLAAVVRSRPGAAGWRGGGVEHRAPPCPGRARARRRRSPGAGMVNTSVLLFALLAVAVVLAVALWVLRPLGRPLAVAVGALALCAGTGGLYLAVGTPAALRAPVAAADAPQSLADAVAQLAAELARNPAQPEGWVLLGRSQAALGNAAAARDAYARALDYAPDEPDLLVDAAEARALAHPQRLFDEQAVAWLQRARQLVPGHARAGWFIGVAQRQAGQAAAAARTWEALLPGVDEATARSLRLQIDA